jgi:hypothetical protein
MLNQCEPDVYDLAEYDRWRRYTSSKGQRLIAKIRERSPKLSANVVAYGPESPMAIDAIKGSDDGIACLLMWLWSEFSEFEFEYNRPVSVGPMIW